MSTDMFCPAVSDSLDGIDVRLVVSDIDGTLLDGDGNIPDEFWPLLEYMHSRGVVFAAASGRQRATLEKLFAPVKDHMAFLAENGTMAVHQGTVIKVRPLDQDFARRLIGRIRQPVGDAQDLNALVCGRRSGYIQATDPAFVAQVRTFYENLEVVDDLLDVEDDLLKVAVYDKGDAEKGIVPILREYCAPNQVVVSTKHWVDIMAPGANKGTAVGDLQQILGVTPAQTVVFGDYLNDLEMMYAADHSFAMANAHPDLISAARHIAPSHLDLGVITTLRRLLYPGQD